MRRKHPNKELEAAIRYAEMHGWTVHLRQKGKTWGILVCPVREHGNHRKSIHATPGRPENRAREIRRLVDRCRSETP